MKLENSENLLLDMRKELEEAYEKFKLTEDNIKLLRENTKETASAYELKLK